MSVPRPWAVVTARCSWLVFFVIALTILIDVVPGLRVLQDLVVFLAALGGLLCGVVSLYGVRRFGRRGILMPACIGIILNVFVLATLTLRFIVSS